jgi:putative aldouronate transport system substrate-binding protein
MSKKLPLLVLAVVFVSGLAFAAGSQEAPDEADGELEFVNLTWYMVGNPNTGEDEVYAVANEYLEEEINANIDFEVFAAGEFNERMSVKIAAAEEFDLTFTADWINNFYQNVGRGAFADVSELLPVYAPDRYAAVPQWVWEGLTIDGSIYGMVNGFIAWQDSVYVRADLAEQYNLEPGVDDLEDFEAFFLRVLEGEGFAPFPQAGGTRNGQFINRLSIGSGLEFVAGLGLPAAFFIGDEDVTIINPYETAEVAEHFELMHRWYDLGIINSDAPVLQSTQPLYQAGRWAAGFDGAYYEGKAEEREPTIGENIAYTTSEPFVPFDAILKTITAVSATSENPERAVMAYNLANTDRDFFRLLGAGIEGVHYEDLGDNYIRPIPNSGYPAGWSWAWGDLDRNGFQFEGTPPGMLESKVRSVEIAEPSPILGFGLNTEPVRTELAQITSVIDEVLPTLGVGAVEPREALDELNRRLESAGLERFLDEVQRQIDGFLADR